jgi:membrane-associated protease RseP (regulator of RpoE activity)
VGVYVTCVTEGGPADQAGLRGAGSCDDGDLLPGGDLIVAIDGHPLETFNDLISYLVSSTQVGQQIFITVIREGEEVELTLAVGARPSRPATPPIRVPGVVLTEHDLQELMGFRSPHPVLSVYLHVDPTAGSSDTHKLRLRQMLKELGPGAAVDAQAVQSYVEHEYGWSSRSLALSPVRPPPSSAPLD